MDTPDPARVRLWRARKRHDHIDAVLIEGSSTWELRLMLNRRLLLQDRFDNAEAARDVAADRLHELQRAGWNSHW